MSISEARRQADAAYSIYHNDYYWMDPVQSNRSLGGIIAYGISALVEAVADSKPYDGGLPRVPTILMRQLIIDVEKAGLDDISMEDLLIAIKARLKSSDLDETSGV